MLHCGASTILWLVCVIVLTLWQSWACFRTAHSIEGLDCDGRWKQHSGPSLSSLLSRVTGTCKLPFPVWKAMWCDCEAGPAQSCGLRGWPLIYSLSSEAEGVHLEIRLPADCWLSPLGQGSEDAAVTCTASLRRCWLLRGRTASVTCTVSLYRCRLACAHPLFFFFFPLSCFWD